MGSLYNQGKENLIRYALIVFSTRSEYNQVDLDSVLRKVLSTTDSIEPTCEVDHVRLGMVDLGLVSRSKDGSVYSLVEESLLNPSNIRSMFGESYPVERIKTVQHLRKKESTFRPEA